LKDEWVNDTENDKLLFKVEQDLPEMKNLDPDNMVVKQIPGSTGFWEFTSDFNKLYSADEEGYILKA
jgi:hypothetical protein